MYRRRATVLLAAAIACAYSPRLTKTEDGWHAAGAPYRIAPLQDGSAMPPIWLPMENTARGNDFGLQRAADTIYGGVVAWNYGSERAVDKTPRQILEQLMENAARKRVAEGGTQPFDTPDNEGNGFRGEQTEGWERTSIRAYRIQGGPASGQIIEMRAYFAVIRSTKGGEVMVISYLSPPAVSGFAAGGGPFDSGVGDVKDLARRIVF